jgi:O-antigen/teichoic acid export membrane protein
MKPGRGLRRLTGDAVALALGGVLAQAAFLGIEAYMARSLGAAAYGTFSAALAYGLVLVLLLDSGMNSRLLQDATRDPASVGRNLGTMLVTKVAFFLALYPVSLGLFQVLGYDAAFRSLFAILAFYALVMTVQDSLGSVFSALQRLQLTALFQGSVPLLTLLFVLIVGAGGLSLNLLAGSYLLAMVAVTVVWFGVARRTVRPLRFELSHVATILRGSYLYGLTALVSQTSFRAGVILLSLLREAADVAIFAAAFRIVDLGYKLPVLVTRVMTPRLFADRYHAPERYPVTCEVLLRLAAAASGAIGVLLLVTGSELAGIIFGSQFAQSGALLEVLGVSLALKMFSVLGQTVLVTSEDHAFRARIVGASAVVSVGLSVPMILWYGPMGAVIGVVAGDICVTGLLLYRLRYLLPATRIAPLVLTPLAAALPATFAASYLPGPALAAPAGVAVYVALLFAAGYLGSVFNTLRKGMK